MIEPVLAKMVYERLQTDFWLIFNFRRKNLTALQSQLAITMTYVVASTRLTCCFFPAMVEFNGAQPNSEIKSHTTSKQIG